MVIHVSFLIEKLILYWNICHLWLYGVGVASDVLGCGGEGDDCSNIKLFVERVQLCSVLRIFTRYFQTFSRFCNIVKPRAILVTH